MFARLDDGDLTRPIRAAFGLGEPNEEANGLIEHVFPAGDPTERMLLASGATRAGLLALADEVLAALDTLIENRRRCRPRFRRNALCPANRGLVEPSPLRRTSNI
jgi:hypothetical protein